jgi:hypothetical protein
MTNRVLSGSSRGLDWRLTVEPDGAEVSLLLEVPAAERESRCRALAVPPVWTPCALRSAGRTGPERILVWCHPSVRRVDVAWEERTLLRRRPRIAPIELHQVELDGVSAKAGVLLLPHTTRRRDVPVRLSGTAGAPEGAFTLAV